MNSDLYIIEKGYLSPFIPTKDHNLLSCKLDYVAKGIDSLYYTFCRLINSQFARLKNVLGQDTAKMLILLLEIAKFWLLFIF